MSLLFFDVDATLWTHQPEIPESAVKAIRRARQNGHRVFINTGRSRANVFAPELMDIGWDGVVSGCGTRIEYQNEVIYQHLMSGEEVEKCYRTLRDNNLSVIFEGPEFQYYNPEDFVGDRYIDFLDRELKDRKRRIPEILRDMVVNKMTIESMSEEAVHSEAKLNGEVYDYSKMIPDYARCMEEIGDIVEGIHHVPWIAELVPLGHSKGTGIEFLADYLKVPIEDTYAVGDSANDLAMLTTAGHAIVMGNGKDEVKKIAEYVTASVWEDGIEKALSHYGLI